MQADRPKQFIMLHGKPLIYYSIKAFSEAIPGIQIIIVLPEDSYDEYVQLVGSLYPSSDFVFCIGGETRFHSVQNGLAMISDETESVILVHDSARCLVSADLIRRCADAAAKGGSAIPVIACSDSIRWVEDNENHPLDRAHVRLVQTPQAFSSRLILPAFHTVYLPAFTDEATVVEHMGHKVALVEGDPKNIKVTRTEDLLLAEAFLSHTSFNP